MIEQREPLDGASDLKTKRVHQPTPFKSVRASPSAGHERRDLTSFQGAPAVHQGREVYCMAATPRTPGPSRPRRPPATTPEAREKQLISLATDLAEKRLRDGSATAQEVIHYLKMAAPRERLEREKLEHENQLLKAKTDAIKSAANSEQLFKEAIEAMQSYRPTGDDRED